MGTRGLRGARDGPPKRILAEISNWFDDDERTRATMVSSSQFSIV